MWCIEIFLEHISTKEFLEVKKSKEADVICVWLLFLSKTFYKSHNKPGC